MSIPTRSACFGLLWHHNVPSNVIRHSIAVSKFAAEIAEKLKARGIKVDSELLDRACLLHDIGKLESLSNGGNHEEIGCKILKKHGCDEVAEVIRKHPIHYILDQKNKPSTWEEKILYYADKRAKDHKIVTIRQRLDDFRKRYPKFRESIDRAEPLILKLEKELLG